MPYLFNDDKSKVIVKRDLLWTNPSPSAAFSSQTISLDLTNYDYIEIEFYHTVATQSVYKFEKCIKGGRSYVQIVNVTSSSYELISRAVTPNNSGVSFGGGADYKYNYSTGGTYTDAPAFLRPIKIYGIKAL